MRVRMMGSRWVAVAGCVLAAALCAGCAGGRVLTVKKDLAAGAVTRSHVFLVKSFDIQDAVFTGDNSGNAAVVASQKQRIPTELTSVLVAELSRAGLQAKAYSKDAAAGNSVVIDGVIPRVNHGSGFNRAFWGMGAGAAWMMADVKLYKPETPAASLAEFRAEGTSGGRGGLLATGDFTSTNILDLARSIASYLTKRIQ